MKKNFEKLLKREGVFLFRLRVFVFCEGVFAMFVLLVAMLMGHPPSPLHKGDVFILYFFFLGQKLKPA